MQTLDWILILGFLAVYLAIGLLVARRAGSSSTEYFLSGRHMPWWLLGISMVATTFSTDTPNLVTDIVRTQGVAGNWQWWAFLLTGMLTCFLFARLWRRSGVTTDLEFYELRYAGKGAAVLRGFRALYLGVLFNVLIMASVTLAAIKIGGVLLGLTPLQTVLIAGTVTVVYALLGGLTGVLITDLIQFGVAMFGAIAAAFYALDHPDVGGLQGLLQHPNLAGKLSILPDFEDTGLVVSVLIIPLAVQWWSVWYPGAEPGGGGYIAQRMLAARDERNAQGATLLFNAAHYALRPWPWILVGLASLIVFPDLASLRASFPDLPADVPVKHDLAYPAMLSFLPAGLLGLVIASLIAAYMSTISTHLNWGSSYIVHDFYHRFVAKDATEKQLVRAGRISTAALMVAAATLALLLESALATFQIMLQVGAGTGLLFILRWFWWRINPASELTAMIVSFAIAVLFKFEFAGRGLADWEQMVLGVAITTAAWVTVALVTKPTQEAALRRFYRLIRPGGPGWAAVVRRAAEDGETLDHDGAATNIPAGLLCMVLGCLAIYGTLFATGSLLYGQLGTAVFLAASAAAAVLGIVKLWPRL